MAKVEITINGKAYPCMQTMGAMLRFKQETGKEATEMDGGFTDLCTYLWCCIVSACKADGIDFDLSLMEFADSIDPDTMAAWTNTLDSGETKPEGAEKKRTRKSK